MLLLLIIYDVKMLKLHLRLYILYLSLFYLFELYLHHKLTKVIKFKNCLIMIVNFFDFNEFLKILHTYFLK